MPASRRPPARLASFLVSLSLTLLFVLASCATGPEVQADSVLQPTAVPAGFSDTLVANLSKPTALAATPDGRLLIATQGGKLYVLKNGQLTLARTIQGICADAERGLLGVAVDPQFAQNRYLYLYYTARLSAADGCPKNSSRSPVNRVVRFSLPDTNVIPNRAPFMLIDNIPSPNANHNGGDLHFGKDGLLYVSVGDGGAVSTAAGAKNTVLGKILRVTKTGGIPTTNPYRGANSVRCNVTGRAAVGKVCQEIFASGLRNPFRIAFDPNAAGTRFFINDVGQNTREEVDEGVAGADYGWNRREGVCATGTTNCGAPPAGLTNPVFDYAHAATGCRSISGGAFVPTGVWPSAYGGYLFADFVCGKMFRLTPSGSGYSVSTFADGFGAYSLVALTFLPSAGSQALYYTTYANGGQVRRISYTAP